MLNGKGVPLGRILGVPIYLDWSWFLVFALMTWSLGAGRFLGSSPAGLGRSTGRSAQ
jgi:hypothetical protein